MTTVIIPIPEGVSGNGPTDVFPSVQGGYGTSGVPYYDLLNQFLEYLSANPDSLSAKLNLVGYIATLSAGGVLNSPAVISLLETAGLLTATTSGSTTTYTISPEFETIIQEGALAGMFNGYTAQTADSSAGITAGEVCTGANGAIAFLNDLSAYFSQSESPAMQAVLTYVSDTTTLSSDATAAQAAYDAYVNNPTSANLTAAENAAAQLSADWTNLNVPGVLSTLENDGLTTAGSTLATDESNLAATVTGLIGTNGILSSSNLQLMWNYETAASALTSAANSAQTDYNNYITTCANYGSTSSEAESVLGRINSVDYNNITTDGSNLIAAYNSLGGLATTTITNEESMLSTQLTNLIGGNGILTKANLVGAFESDVTTFTVEENMVQSDYSAWANTASPSDGTTFNNALSTLSTDWNTLNAALGSLGTLANSTITNDVAGLSPNTGGIIHTVQADYNNGSNNIGQAVGILGSVDSSLVNDANNFKSSNGISTGLSSLVADASAMSSDSSTFATSSNIASSLTTLVTDASAAATDASNLESSAIATSVTYALITQIEAAIAQVESQVSVAGGLAATYGFSTTGNNTTKAGTINYTNLDGTVSTYSASNASDKAFIQNYIANITTTGAPDTFFSSMNANAVEKEYRVTAVNNLVASYPTDPSIVLCLFMGMMADNLTQIQLSGLANTSNILNNMANTYTTPLLQVVQSINGTGSITSTQAEQFVTLLYTATDLINTTPQLSSIASAWNANVFNTIGNISVTFSNTYGQTVKTTLGNVMSGGPDTNGGADPGQAPYSSTDVAAALQSLQQLDSVSSSGVSSTAGTNAAPGYQAILDAVQQGGSLVTNQSQTISTQVGTLTQNDAQYLAFLSMISSSTGGGFAQLMLYLCSSTQQAAH